MHHRRVVAVSATALLGIAVLAGCSSGSSSSPSTTPPATTSASPSEIGGSVLPPVMVPEDQNEVTAKVGDVIVFSVADPGAWKIATSDPAMLEVSQGGKQGSAVMNPGATALKAGKATITLTPDDGTPRVVIVTVTEA